MANITYRLVKGSPLTNQEVDDNFSALDTDKLEASDLTAEAVSFDNTSSDLLALTVQAALQELELGKVSTGDLRVGVTLFPTDTIHTGSEYLAVDNTADAEYNSTAVNIPTGGVSADGLIATVTSEAGVAIGEILGVNVSLVGEIRKTAGNQNEYANFYYEVYHRDTSAGTDTLIATSGRTLDVLSSSYEEYSANAFIQGPVDFAEDDRIVLKFYAGDVSANSPEYDFLFGGSTPIRFSMPVALANVSTISDASDVIVATGSFSGLLSVTDSDVQTALETLDVSAIGEAPADGNQYLRQNGSWQQLVFESEKLEIAHHYHVRMHKSLDKVYTDGAYYDSQFLFDIGTYTNGIYDYATSSSTFSKEFVHTLPDTAFTGDLDLKQLRWNANLAVLDANLVEVKFALVAVEEFYGTERVIGETDSQFVTNTAFNDFQFDFFGATFTASGSTTVLPHEYLRVQGFIASPTGNSATLRIEHDPAQGNGEGWCLEVVNYDKGVSDITFPTMPYTAADDSGNYFQQWPYTTINYAAGARMKFGNYQNNYTFLEFFGQGLVLNYQGEFALNSSQVGGTTDWSLRNVDIDVLEGNYDLAVNDGFMRYSAATGISFIFDTTGTTAGSFNIYNNSTSDPLFQIPSNGSAWQIHNGSTLEFNNAAGTDTPVVIDGEAGTIQLNGSNVLTVDDTPTVAGTEVVQKTSGMHWMPISKRSETYFSGSVANQVGEAVPIVDKNWEWDEYTLSGGAGVASSVARINFPQGAFVGDVGDLQMTVQVRLRHTGSVPIEFIRVGYGKRTPEGAVTNIAQDDTVITSTTSEADYTAALTTTTGLMSVTADDQLYVQVYIGAASAWEAIISDTGNGSDILTAVPIGVYAGSKRFIGAQDVHIGGSDVRIHAHNQAHLDGQYVNIGRDTALNTYIDSQIRTEYKSGGAHQFEGSQLEFRSGGSLTERAYFQGVQRNDGTGLVNTVDLIFNNYQTQPNAVNVNRVYTTKVNFYSQSQGFQGDFVGTAASLYDADTLALATDITSLQAQINALSANKIGDAPLDGKTYVRQNGEWVSADLGLDLLIYPFDGGLADTALFAETMDGGASDTLVFDDAISPVLGGLSNSTYEVSPLISGLADMSTLAGANFNVDGGRASTTLFSSNFDGGAA